MILGLDISTSITGWCVLDENGNLENQGFINLSKKKTLYVKAAAVKIELNLIHVKYDIQKVFIEENLQSFRSGFSSAKTISTLAKFNGIVSYLSFEEFYNEPVFLNVNSARKNLGIKIEREKACGVSTKQQVLDWVMSEVSGSFMWPTKILKSGPRKGQMVLQPGCFDMADAYVIARSGLEMNI